MWDGNLYCLKTKAVADLILPKPLAQFGRDKADVAHYLYLVQYNGRLLAGAENANLCIVEQFSLLHHTQRRNERRDPSDGHRAARYAKSLRGVWFDLSDKEMELLTEALKYHSDGYTEADITVQVCWDADRLDLGRVGIKPAPHRLCTASAKSVDILEAAL